MLNKIMNVRAVLDIAALMEKNGVPGLAGACNALQDLKDIHTALMGVEEANNDLQDWEIGEGIAHG